jgi:hypothetical protein
VSTLTTGGHAFQPGSTGLSWVAPADWIAAARALRRVEQTSAVEALICAVDRVAKSPGRIVFDSLTDPLLGEDEATRGAGWGYEHGGIGSPRAWRPTGAARELPEFPIVEAELAAAHEAAVAENRRAVAEDRAASRWY